MMSVMLKAVVVLLSLALSTVPFIILNDHASDTSLESAINLLLSSSEILTVASFLSCTQLTLEGKRDTTIRINPTDNYGDKSRFRTLASYIGLMFVFNCAVLMQCGVYMFKQITGIYFGGNEVAFVFKDPSYVFRSFKSGSDTGTVILAGIAIHLALLTTTLRFSRLVSPALLYTRRIALITAIASICSLSFGHHLPPITHTSVSIIQSALIQNHYYETYDDEFLMLSRIYDSSQEAVNYNGEHRPDVVVIVHESLSEMALMSSGGLESAPIYHHTRTVNHNFFAASNALSVAGVTEIAIPSILTGQLPWNKEALDNALRVKLARRFARNGYRTGLFASYPVEWAGTTWAALDNVLKNGGYDTVGSPKTLTDQGVTNLIMNDMGMADNNTLTLFAEWLRDVEANTVQSSNENQIYNTSSAKNDSNYRRHQRFSKLKLEQTRPPIFAVIIVNDNHWPFLGLDDEKKETNSEYGKYSNYFSSLKSFDRTFQRILELMNDIGTTASSDAVPDVKSKNAGESNITSDNVGGNISYAGLSNTFIVGVGDHGETPGEKYRRISRLSAPVLQVPLYMHLPHWVIEKHRQALRMNLRDTVSTLDIVPTLHQIMGWWPPIDTGYSSFCTFGMGLFTAATRRAERILLHMKGPPAAITELVALTVGNKSIFVDNLRKLSYVGDIRSNVTNPTNQVFENNFCDLSESEKIVWTERTNSLPDYVNERFALLHNC
eukprot:CFRG0468T1